MRIAGTAALLLIGMLPCPAAEGKRWLGVVGIGNYRDGAYAKVPPAENGARELKVALLRNFQYTAFSNSGAPEGHLLGERATRDRARDYVKELAAAAGPEDDILLFWAGHGKRLDNGNSYLIPHDAPGGAKPDDAIAIDWLLAELDASRAANVLVVLDACESGLRVDVPKPDQERGVRVLLTSAGPDQVAGDTGGYANATLFTGHLLRMIKEWTCDPTGEGSCTAADLTFLLRRRIREDRPSQTPDRFVFGRGSQVSDFRLRRTGPEAAAWELAKQCEGAECRQPTKLDTFLREHPASPFAEAARILRRERIQKSLEAGGFIVTNELAAVPGVRVKNSAIRPEDGGEYQWIARDGGSFWIGRYEVTVGQYRKFRRRIMPRAPGFNRGWRDSLQPMVNVSWADAMAFCTAAGGSLPTLEEWRYAAFAGEPQVPYPWGTTSKGRAAYANLAGDGTDGVLFAAGVRRYCKGQNDWNVFNMLGNVSEWTADRVNRNGTERAVIAGASYADSWDRADLNWSAVSELKGNNTIGFRCVVRPSGGMKEATE